MSQRQRMVTRRPRKARRTRRPNANNTKVKVGRPSKPMVHDRAESKLKPVDVDFNKILGNKSYHTLTYAEDDVLTMSSVDFALDTYRISDIFDPNPSLLTGGITGYAEFTAIFFKWIVNRVYIDLAIVNQEPAKPITIGVIFNPDNLSSTILSRANAINALERPGTMVKSVMLAPSAGQNRVTNLHFKVNPSTVYGNSALYFGSVNFSGSTPAGPPQELYVHVIVIGPAALSLSSGILSSIKLTYDVKFFSVAPGLLSEDEIELRYLYEKHKLELKRLGNEIINKKVIQCRIDFLESITRYHKHHPEFMQLKDQQLLKLNSLLSLATKC